MIQTLIFLGFFKNALLGVVIRTDSTTQLSQESLCSDIISEQTDADRFFI